MGSDRDSSDLMAIPMRISSRSNKTACAAEAGPACWRQRLISREEAGFSSVRIPRTRYPWDAIAEKPAASYHKRGCALGIAAPNPRLPVVMVPVRPWSDARRCTRESPGKRCSGETVDRVCRHGRIEIPAPGIAHR